MSMLVFWVSAAMSFVQKISFPGGTASAGTLSPGTVSAAVAFDTGGKVRRMQGGGFSDWHTWHDDEPIGFGGADFEIMATLVSGTTPTTGPALNTWHSLSTGRQWTNTQSGFIGIKTSTLGVTIREIANPSHSHSANYTITAEVTDPN